MSPYTDKRTANKYDLPLTGAAKAEYDSISTLKIPIMAIKESTKTAKELLGGETPIVNNFLKYDTIITSKIFYGF